MAKLLSQKSNTWDKHADVPNQTRKVDNPEDLEPDDCQYREAASRKYLSLKSISIPPNDAKKRENSPYFSKEVISLSKIKKLRKFQG